jgi:hypothetical protein
VLCRDSAQKKKELSEENPTAIKQDQLVHACHVWLFVCFPRFSFYAISDFNGDQVTGSIREMWRATAHLRLLSQHPTTWTRYLRRCYSWNSCHTLLQVHYVIQTEIAVLRPRYGFLPYQYHNIPTCRPIAK